MAEYRQSELFSFIPFDRLSYYSMATVIAFLSYVFHW